MNVYDEFVKTLAQKIVNSGNFLEIVRTEKSDVVENEAWKLWDLKQKQGGRI